MTKLILETLPGKLNVCVGGAWSFVCVSSCVRVCTRTWKHSSSPALSFSSVLSHTRTHTHTQHRCRPKLYCHKSLAFCPLPLPPIISPPLPSPPLSPSPVSYPCAYSLKQLTRTYSLLLVSKSRPRSRVLFQKVDPGRVYSHWIRLQSALVHVGILWTPTNAHIFIPYIEQDIAGPVERPVSPVMTVAPEPEFTTRRLPPSTSGFRNVNLRSSRVPWDWWCARSPRIPCKWRCGRPCK